MRIITTHTGADFDALASMLAASKLFPDAVMFLPGSPEKQVREYLKTIGFPGKLVDFKKIIGQKIEQLIIVDTSYKSRLGRIAEIIDPETQIHIYDHHPKSGKDMKGNIEVREKYGANTTMFVKRLMEKNIQLNPEEATLIAMGIYEDTGCFTYTITTPDDLEAVKFLLQNGASLKIISKYVIHEINEEQVDLLNKLLISKSHVETETGRITFVYTEITEYVEELSVVVHKIMDIIKPEALFALIKIKSRIICISRSRSRDIDVGKILSHFGGGGHPTAASTTFDGISIPEAKNKLIEFITKSSESSLNEFRLTKKPAKVIPISNTAEQAYHTLSHLNLKYAPVGTGSGDIEGIVQKVELEKAIRHGLSEHQVKEFISRQIPAVAETDSDKEIRKKMAASGYPFLILKNLDGKISGVLENKIHEGETIGEPDVEPSYEFVTLKLKNNLSDEIFDIIKIASDIAVKMNISAYCVGGMVRDILMDIKHQDIDIVVEKGVRQFASELAGKLNGHVSFHEKFKTAVIKILHREIDVATLRKEYYEFPAALPKVAEGTLKQDLHRRDFSINAMAIQISPEKEFGRLIDYYDGKKDLDNGVVNIMYPLSFIEDPTRIFRAIRFEKRFGFSLSEDTLKQLKKTVSMDIHSRLTTDRVREEIILILKEKIPEEILSRLGDLGGLSCIHPQLMISDKIYKLINEYPDVPGEFSEELKKIWQKMRWEIMMMIILSEITPGQGEQVLSEFQFPKKFISNYLKCRKYKVRIEGLLKKNITNARIYKSLHFLSLEVLFYIFVVCRDKKIKETVIRYLVDLRDVVPELQGEDLKKMGYIPCPGFTKMLFTLKLARLNGNVKNLKEEKEFILNKFPNNKILK